VDETPEWQPCKERILAAPGVVMVLGSTDVGKTTFCAELANAAFAAGIPCAVVDADVGQSEIGPPGAIGLGIVEERITTTHDLRPRRMYFVGDISPVGHLVQCVVGVKKMVDEASVRGAKIVIVDTTGLIHGTIGSKLKTYKIDLVQPAHLAAIQKAEEAEHILRAFERREGLITHRVTTSPHARSRSQELRVGRRRLRLYEHFRMAEQHKLRLDDVDCWGTWLGAGHPLSWQETRNLEGMLDARVLHAEAIGTGLYVVAGSRYNAAGIERIKQELKFKSVAFTQAAKFEGVLVGLSDSVGNTIEVGIVKKVDFVERTITVISPIRSTSPVRRVVFGSLRAAEDGTEIGRLRAGEI